MVLQHYTSASGRMGILREKAIWPSLRANNPKDARFGDGQYLSDIAPGSKRPGQLSRIFLGMPFAGRKFTDYVSIETEGLNVFFCRESVFLIRNSTALDISSRLVTHGKN